MKEQPAAGAEPLLKIIQGHPFLKGVSPEHLAILADSAMETEFKAGDFIFREGDPANRFYLVQEGRVALESARSPCANPIQIAGAGDVLGWSWLFAPYQWQFDARAIEPVKAIFFYGSRLREQCEDDHNLGYELMKRMAEVAIDRLQASRHRLIEACRKMGETAEPPPHQETS